MTLPGEALRDILRANLFDGDEGGTVTMPIAQLLTDIVDIIEEHALAAPVAGGLDEERLGLLRALSLTHHIFDLPIGEDVTYSRGYSAGIGAAREVFREAIYAALAANQPVGEEGAPCRSCGQTEGHAMSCLLYISTDRGKPFLPRRFVDRDR